MGVAAGNQSVVVVEAVWRVLRRQISCARHPISRKTLACRITHTNDKGVESEKLKLICVAQIRMLLAVTTTFQPEGRLS